MRMPEAEIDVTVELVDELISRQHPDLRAPLTMVANGWDNVIFRLGESMLVRLPRRRAAAQLVINEQRWLPLLSEGLPAPIPAPVRVGTPADDYPWNWTIGPWFDGVPLIDVPVADRATYARPLAEFLAALHQPALSDAPRSPVRGVPLIERVALADEHLASGLIPSAERLRQLWQRLVASPAWEREPVWVHGDPHPANVLTRGSRLAAVIDFGDINAGDPATDLAAAWMTFDDVGRQAFRDHYTQLTGADEPTWNRARAWAIALGMALVANSDDNAQLAAVGHHALAEVVA